MSSFCNSEREDPRDAYLDAARSCILDVGWRRTSMTEVARRAGVSRMTIYRAWPDMGALLGDLMTREWGHLLVRVSPSGAERAAPRAAPARPPSRRHTGRLSSDGADTGRRAAGDRMGRHGLAPAADASPEAIAAVVVHTVAALRADPLFRRIIAVDPDLLLPYLFERRGRLQDQVLGLLTDTIRTGQRAGLVRRGRPETLARGVLLLTHGFALSGPTMADARVSAKALDRELATAVSRSLAP